MNLMNCDDEWLLRRVFRVKIIFIFQVPQEWYKTEAFGKKRVSIFYHQFGTNYKLSNSILTSFVFQWWHKFSTAFRGMLVDAVVRARDFFGNPTAESAINDSIREALNFKAEVDTNGNVFRLCYTRMVFVESVLSKNINLKLFVT